MEQLDLFATGELIEIRRFLTCWNEAERQKRLDAVAELARTAEKEDR